MAARQGSEPGSLFWDTVAGQCRAAVVLSPDRALAGSTLVLDLGLLALFDALAGLAPPKTPVWIVPPAGIAIDGGAVASVRTDAAATAMGGIPEWAILGIEVRVSDTGAAPGRSCLADEGFGDVTSADVLSRVCRHLLGWLDVWRTDGAGALARAVAGRTGCEALSA